MSKPMPPAFPPSLSFDETLTEVEIREDEEQNVKLQEIIDLLLAAGYFRARIKGLSPFDKIVGGMTWCIETCNVDIDIDLLFQENLSIGQKIGLTEKIVSVLPHMKCPYLIEPHQIQGLDSIHIFPVVQWLVKRSIETREEMGNYIRSYSVSQFNKYHAMPEDVEYAQMKEKVSSSLLSLKEAYRPTRKYRHPAPQKIVDEEMRVQTTLLEYGKHYGLTHMMKVQKDEDQAAEDGAEKAEQQRIQVLMNSMAATEEHETRLTASAVGSIVGLQSAEIQQIASEFADKKAQLAGKEHVGGVQQHRRVVGMVNKHITAKSALLEEAKDKHHNLHGTYTLLQSTLKELQEKRQNLQEQMSKMDEMETEENKSILQKLRSLVMTNESLKRQEQEFKAHCKEELVRLRDNVTEFKSSPGDRSRTEDQERKLAIEKQHQSDMEKLQKMRVMLAKKNREIATLMRKIDEVPTRAELSQYQRRFVELYNQVAAKHKETKQFYTFYNSLEDSRMYLSREVNLLNSILDNFPEAMASSTSKEEFLNQFEKIVEGIRQTRIKVEKHKQEEKMRRDRFHDQHLELIEKQRLYFKTVKEFKEECRKNELLVAKLKERGH